MRLKQPALFLAPMAGITDLPFRLICQESGATATYSEMISAASLFYNSQKTNKSFSLMSTCSKEKNFIIQLFGSNPQHFEHATQLIEKLPNKKNFGEADKAILAQPDGIDINFGCPVKKVFKQKAGCALMKEMVLARKIIQAVTDNTKLPVSIKIRAGIEKISALDFLKSIADLPWQTVIVHGRTFSQGFVGEIDLELIKKIKILYPQKTVIANGGIFSPEKAKEVLKKTTADGLAIGRGALGNPFIFSQIKTFLKKNNYQKTSEKCIQEVIKRHLNYFKKYCETKNFQELKKHLLWYLKKNHFPKEKKLLVAQAKSWKKLLKIF